MTKKTVTSLALAAGCAIVLAVPAAQAQVRSSWGGSPALRSCTRLNPLLGLDLGEEAS